MEITINENKKVKMLVGDVEIAIVDRLKLLDILKPGDIISSLVHTIEDDAYGGCKLELIRFVEKSD